MKNKKDRLKYFNIIINLILIAIIINLIIDKGIIKGKEKQIIKEMTQSENESNLQIQIDNLNAVQEEYANNVQIYKKQIAEAITSQGISTSENDTGSVMATNIKNILSTGTQATATASDIAQGKTAWVNGEQIIGTMASGDGVVKKLYSAAGYTQTKGWNTKLGFSAPAVGWSIKNKIDDYQNYTVDNFIFIPTNLYNANTANAKTWPLKTAYDSTNGIFYALYCTKDSVSIPEYYTPTKATIYLIKNV